MRSAPGVGFLLLLVLSSAACTTTLSVRTLEPAPTSFGSANRLTVVESTGRRSAREAVIGEVIRQARSTGIFQASDRSEEGIRLKIAGRTATPVGAKPADDEIFVKIDVHEYDIDSVEKEVTEDGKKVLKRFVQGKVLLGVTAATPRGKALLAEREFAGSHLGNGSETDGVILATAARLAVGKFLAEITPTTRWSSIRIDDDDAGQKPIIELARNGSLEKAIEETRAYLQRNPTNAMAIYNLAAYLDASGQYDEALELYSQAISKSANKGWYVDARAACASRQSAVRALAESY